MIKKILVVGMFLGFTTGVGAQTPSLTGKWYGKSVQDGVHCFLSERKADNTYEVTFLGVDRKGKWKKFSEEGTWLLGNGFYVTLTEKVGAKWVNLKDRAYRDVYRVISLTENEFVYQMVGGPRFSAVRTSDVFVLGETCPEPDSFR